MGIYCSCCFCFSGLETRSINVPFLFSGDFRFLVLKHVQTSHFFFLVFPLRLSVFFVLAVFDLFFFQVAVPIIVVGVVQFDVFFFVLVVFFFVIGVAQFCVFSFVAGGDSYVVDVVQFLRR